MLKGLRRWRRLHQFGMNRLTGFPDVEGIETVRPECLRAVSSLTGFPDVEGIETPATVRRASTFLSDRLP